MSARWIEPEGRARDRRGASVSSSASGSVRHRSRAASSSSRICSSSSRRVPFALVAGVEREPEHADRVRLPRPEERRRHREVLVDARERDRLREDVVPARRASARAAARRRRSGWRCRRACSRSCRLVAARRRRAVRSEMSSDAGLPAVRVVGGVDDLLRRDEPEEAEQVDRAPDRGVEEDARACPRSGRRAFGEVGDPGVGEDQLRPRVRVDEAVRAPSAIGGRPRPAWIRIGTPPLRRQLEDRREPLVVEQELLRPRMQLDPARAEVEAAARLLDRPLVEREAHERDQPAVRARRELERAVVAGAEARVPVGLVEAEHEGSARRRSGPSSSIELLVAADHPVDVVCRGACGRRRCRASPRAARRAADSSQSATTCRARSSASIDRNLAAGRRRASRARRVANCVPTPQRTLSARRGGLPYEGRDPSPPIGGTHEPHPPARPALRSPPCCSAPPRRAAAARPASSSARSSPAAGTPAQPTRTTTSSCSTAAPAPSTSPAGRSSTRRPPARPGRRPRWPARSRRGRPLPRPARLGGRDRARRSRRPTPTGTSNLAVSAARSPSSTTPRRSPAAARPAAARRVATVEDLLGYGGAGDYEGSGAAPAPTATTALVRARTAAAPTPTTRRPTSRRRRPASAELVGGREPAARLRRLRAARRRIAGGRRRRAAAALDRARPPDAELPGAVPGTTPAPLPEQRDRDEQRPERLHAHRAPDGVRAAGPAARHRRRRRRASWPCPSRRRRISCSPRRRARARTAATCGRRASASSRRCRSSRPATTRRRSPSR